MAKGSVQPVPRLEGTSISGHEGFLAGHPGLFPHNPSHPRFFHKSPLFSKTPPGSSMSLPPHSLPWPPAPHDSQQDSPRVVLASPASATKPPIALIARPDSSQASTARP